MSRTASSQTSQFPLIVAICATLGLFVYVATAMISPLNGEDFALTRDMAGVAPMDRFGWIIERSSTQITQWNARLGEQLAILWLSVPRIYFVLATTASLLFFCAVVAGYGRRQTDRDSFLHGSIYALAMLWLFWPGYEVFFWTTAQAAYFQPMIPALLLMSFYFTVEATQKLGESNLRCLVAVVLACLVGLSFENVPPALGAGMGLVLLLNGRARWRLRAILPIIALAVAWGTLMLAPSTAIRRAAYAAMYPANLGVGHVLERSHSVFGTLMSTSWLLVLAGTAASVYLWRVHGWRQQVALAWAVSSLTVLSVIAAPYTEPRAFIVPWAIWYMLVVAAAIRLVSISWFRSGAAIVAVASLYLPLQANLSYVEFARSLEERDSYIRVMSRTERCQQGIDVGHATKKYSYKYLNSREAWFVANPAYVSAYYGCKVLPQ
ncbi:DUF6056 family protein [Stenotrophomonas sp.]|uniref:DUF6056 family protein n=1 Tax=Stenotrophomonas sp. TaxID=69392 RepID=UPI0028AFA403|nr:DUF6056 family protein [Stenotrophomonas sp.]